MFTQRQMIDEINFRLKSIEIRVRETDGIIAQRLSDEAAYQEAKAEYRLAGGAKSDAAKPLMADARKYHNARRKLDNAVVIRTELLAALSLVESGEDFSNIKLPSQSTDIKGRKIRSSPDDPLAYCYKPDQDLMTKNMEMVKLPDVSYYYYRVIRHIVINGEPHTEISVYGAYMSANRKDDYRGYGNMLCSVHMHKDSDKSTCNVFDFNS